MLLFITLVNYSAIFGNKTKGQEVTKKLHPFIFCDRKDTTTQGHYFCDSKHCNTICTAIFRLQCIGTSLYTTWRVERQVKIVWPVMFES